MDSTSNTFYITGVQLEIGSNATPYEQLSHQDEKRRCERYYQQTVEGDAIYVGRVSNTNAMNCHHYLTVPMRAQPTISYLPAGAGDNQAFHHNLMDHDSVSTSTSAPTIWGTHDPQDHQMIFYISGGSGLTDSRVACVRSRWGWEIKAEY